MTDCNDAEPGLALVINCGSSSIKYQLIGVPDGRMVAGGLVERIGTPEVRMSHRALDAGGAWQRSEIVVGEVDHRAAFDRIDAVLRVQGPDTPGGLAVIGHRVVHGGERFVAPTRIDEQLIAAVRELSVMAPLHNPANLIGIEVCRDRFPGVAQVAVFDTAFHQTMPARAFRYAVPSAWYREHGVRRYGFHGSSHAYVAERAAALLGRAPNALRLITLHLGNGASAAAISAGRCIDTSMGFTPLEGLAMGTRSGDLDAAVPLYMQRAGFSAEDIDRQLNQASGLKGLCGTNDMREVLARAASGDQDAGLAVDLYCYRIKKYIGAYHAALGGADAVVFTGGVGENSPEIRERVCDGLEALGIRINCARNRGEIDESAQVGQAGSPVAVTVVRTNEELAIARQAYAVVCASGRLSAESAPEA